MTCRPTSQWKRVSVNDIDVYLPRNTPVEASGQTFAFGEAQSRVEAIAPGAEGETAEGAGDGGGDRDGYDRDGDGMASGSNVNSM